jgi:ABC-type sugar transport system ATPase subunit
VIRLERIKRQYGSIAALKDASLTLRPGEFHALLGSNGSGKSTLIKILAGAETPSSGTYEVDGRAVKLRSAGDGRELGIAVAYQDLSLIPSLSVEQNVALALNGATARDGIREARARIAPLLEEINPEIDAATPVSELAIPERYQVEIVKALAQRPKFLVMDEATAALDGQQVKRVFRLLDSFRDTGLSLLFVSHRMDEVLEFCSRATILREGATVAEADLLHQSREELLALLTGQKNQEHGGAKRRAPGPVTLQVQGLAALHSRHPVDLTVHAGEIIGLGGLQGQGQREFLRTLGLLTPPARGQIFVTSERLPLKRRSDARRLVFFLSGDRTNEGIFPRRPVCENTMAQHLAIGGMLRSLTMKGLRETAASLLQRIGVVGHATQPIETLSGGNQQKALLARLFHAKPAMILLDDPTIGVDPASRRQIHGVLRDMADRGTAIVFFSSDDEELLALADRVIVFYENAVVDELAGDRLNPGEIVRASLHTQLQEGVR